MPSRTPTRTPASSPCQPAHSTRQFRLGEALVSVLCLGSIEARLSDWFAQPAGGWPVQHTEAFGQPIRLPVLCVHMALPWASVLFDACDPQAYPTGPGPCLSLGERLALIGVPTTEVSHVVISHGHHDHYCGLVDSATRRPTFAHARHILSRREWANGSLCKAAAEADAGMADAGMLELLDKQGLLDLVEGEQEIVPGLTLIPAPGESPGHVVLRLQAGAAPLYLLGDLYHHRAELDYPALSPLWADAAANSASRSALHERVVQDGGHILCSHICPVLRPQRLGLAAESSLTPRCGCAA